MNSKQALDELLDMIRSADQSFLSERANLDDQGKADGYQHIFHMLHIATDFYLLNDPLYPRFKPLSDGMYKILGDNVDSAYYFTQVRGDQEYIIRGQRFDSCYLSFCLYGGQPHGELSERVTLNINHTDIEFESDGSFEIKLTQNPKGANEFKIDLDSVTLFTREYFFDRPSSTESRLSIENTQPHPKPEPLNDDELATRIRTITNFIQGTTLVAPLPIDFPINEFLPPFASQYRQPGWGTPDNIYCMCRFRVQEDEYLQVRLRSPDACYWGLQTWNFLMQSTNYLDYPVCLNSRTIRPEADGSYLVTLSEKPAEKNWISTAGYREGVLVCRWLLADAMPDAPSVSLHRW